LIAGSATAQEALRKRRLTLAFRQPEVTVTSEWDQYAACVESAILAGLDVSAAYDFSDGKNADVCEPFFSKDPLPAFVEFR
jgi:hypothetical protein